MSTSDALDNRTVPLQHYAVSGIESPLTTADGSLIIPRMEVNEFGSPPGTATTLAASTTTTESPPPTATTLAASTIAATDLLDQKQKAASEPATTKRDWRFWLVFISLCTISFATALDNTIATISFPTISSAIGGAEQYIWISDAYTIAATVVQPFIAQLSNIFGRRVPMLISILLFAIGSGIAGGANNVGMLIAGRGIQGLGAGGIFVLLDIITCDLVPVKERSKYAGFVLSTASVATLLGPLIGGAIASANWRWIFYINLPISAISFIFMFLFLNVKYQPNKTWKAALARVDYVGNFLFVASILCILLGLTWGGTTYAWSSVRIVLLLVLGFLGWAAFHIYELTPYCKEPTIPPRLFSNRTSFVGFLIAFLGMVLLQWTTWFLPVYFQSTLGASPLQSGINVLPFNAFFLPFAISAGVAMSKTGRYRPIHFIGGACMTIAFGLFSTMNADSPKAAWVCFQIIAAAGIGALLSTVLPSIQASLSEADVASSTGMFAFLRSFGLVWGFTIPSIVFNGQIDTFARSLNNPDLQAQISQGKAYGFVGSPAMQALSADVRQKLVGVYVASLQTVWQVGIGFALLIVVLVFFEKHVALRTELETEFGLDSERKKIEDIEHSGSIRNDIEMEGKKRLSDTKKIGDVEVVDVAAKRGSFHQEYYVLVREP